MRMITAARNSVSLAVMLAARSALAQEAPAAPVQIAAADTGPDIVVTGSRIARPDFAAPNPIVSFNAAAIEQSGNTNLTNFLVRVPALTGSRDFTQSSGGNAASQPNPFAQAGLNELNLRNLGTARRRLPHARRDDCFRL